MCCHLMRRQFGKVMINSPYVCTSCVGAGPNPHKQRIREVVPAAHIVFSCSHIIADEFPTRFASDSPLDDEVGAGCTRLDKYGVGGT